MLFSRRRIPVILALALSFGVGLPAVSLHAEDAPSPDEPIAMVNGTPITFSDIALADEEMEDMIAHLEPQMRFQYLLGTLIDRRVVSLEAKAKHIDDDPQVKRRQDFLNERALRDVYWLQLIQGKVTEKAVRAYYDKNIANSPAEKEAHARHILVQSKAEAEKIAKEISSGKAFAEAAQAYSTDKSSGDGDLGWFRRGDMVKEFGDAAFSMKPGELSKPVETQFGWHVIQLVDIRDMAKPSFEEANAEIIRQLAREEGQKLMEELRNKAKIEIVGAESNASSGGRPQLAPAQ